jgi:uncharacterized membrane protein YedE/YeeE
MYEAVFVAPWPWWAGGVALGSFVILYGVVFNRLMGMSGTFENALREWREPVVPNLKAVSLDEAVLQLAREQGLDLAALGITVDVAAPTSAAGGAPLIFSPRFLVLGVFLGALAGGVLSGAQLSFGLGPVFDGAFPIGPWLQGGMLLGGGYMVGLGARMAGGCPSGHGLGGLSLLSPGSFVALAGYFTTGIVVTFLVRALA